jgi:hypothetical protein
MKFQKKVLPSSSGLMCKSSKQSAGAALLADFFLLVTFFSLPVDPIDRSSMFIRNAGEE